MFKLKLLTYVFYYENGNIKSESYYNKSKEKTGTWKDYNEDGMLIKTTKH